MKKYYITFKLFFCCVWTKLLLNIFNEYKWNDKLDTTYQIFDFFYKNKKTIDLLYKANLQFFLVDNILINFNYKKDDPNIIAYSKVMVAYLVFGLQQKSN